MCFICSNEVANSLDCNSCRG